MTRRPGRGTSPSLLRTGIGLVAMLALLTACTSTGATAGATDGTGAGKASVQSGLGSLAKNRNVVFIMHEDPADPFHATIAQGAKDAAAQFNIKLKLQSAYGDQVKYLDLVTKAAASKPAGLAIVLDDPDLYTDVVCKARDDGMAVITFNMTQPNTDVAKCTLAYVGQDERPVGRSVGDRLLADFPQITAGDVVFAPVEFPEEVYAKGRGAGVQDALDTVGATMDVVATDIDDAGAVNVMTQYLLAHPHIAAITPLGGTPMRNVVQAMQDAGVSVPVVGFDVAPKILEDIKSGAIDATADQQGYVQGFQSVAQLALYLDFRLSPANINSGGSGLIDKSNVSEVEALVGKVR